MVEKNISFYSFCWQVTWHSHCLSRRENSQDKIRRLTGADWQVLLMRPAGSVAVSVSHSVPSHDHYYSHHHHQHHHYPSHLLNPLLHLKRNADPRLFCIGMFLPLWSWASSGQDPRAKVGRVNIMRYVDLRLGWLSLQWNYMSIFSPSEDCLYSLYNLN